MIDDMFRNLTYKDALEYTLVNSCESSKHVVVLCEENNLKKIDK